MPNISIDEAMKLLADAGLNFAQSALRIILVIVAGYIITKVVKVAVKHLEAILIRFGEGSDDVPGATNEEGDDPNERPSDHFCSNHLGHSSGGCIRTDRRRCGAQTGYSWGVGPGCWLWCAKLGS